MEVRKMTVRGCVRQPSYEEGGETDEEAVATVGLQVLDFCGDGHGLIRVYNWTSGLLTYRICRRAIGRKEQL
jgi:hypothetical protein